MSVKRIAGMLVAVLLLLSFAACGKNAEPVDPKTCTYDEMVAYLTEKGYIASDASPVDILATEGYLTDNTEGSIPYAPVADRAEDYGGLWLFWWDAENCSEAYQECFENIAANGGAIVYEGGAAILQTEAVNGSFAIAFAGDYGKRDAALADFQALSGK